MTQAIDVLNGIISAWRDQDVEAVLVHVTDDVIWRGSAGYGPAIRGKAALRQLLTEMKSKIARDEWRIFDYAQGKDRLLVEGVDEFWLKTGERVVVPYAGSVFMRGHLVCEWREYFDGRISSEMKAGKLMTPELEEIISTPAK
jgi:limonene-1,2-epoxide hydrolase